MDDETAESLREQDDYDLISEEYPDESNATNNKKLERIVGLLMGKKSAYELYVHGHLMEDMIINCSWKGFDCNKGLDKKMRRYSLSKKGCPAKTLNLKL